MNRVLIVFLVCCVCVRAHASFGGGYVGASGGVAHQSVDFDASYLVIPTTDNTLGRFVINSTRDTEVSKWNGWGEIIAGWGMKWNESLYVGACLGANFSSYGIIHRFFDTQLISDLTIVNAVIAPVTEKVTLDLGAVEFSADFKTGYIFNQRTLLFALIGAAVNQEKLLGKVEASVIPVSGAGVLALPPQQTNLNVSKRRLAAAFRIGLGIEEKLTQRLGLNLQYLFTCYQKMSAAGAGTMLGFNITNGSEALVAFPNGIRNTVRGHPYKNVASVGLTYYY